MRLTNKLVVAPFRSPVRSTSYSVLGTVTFTAMNVVGPTIILKVYLLICS